MRGLRHLELRSSVRQLCEKYPGEYWRALDEKKGFPAEFVDDFTKRGFMDSLALGQVSLAECCSMLDEVNATGCNASFVHGHLYMSTLLRRYCSDVQKEKIKGKRIQAFGVTEQDSGSATFNLKTRAKKSLEGMYVINGSKLWTSRIEHSDYLLLLARTAGKEEKEKRKQLSLFLVDIERAKQEGSLTINPIKTMMNHCTTQIFLDNLSVPESMRVGAEGEGT